MCQKFGGNHFENTAVSRGLSGNDSYVKLSQADDPFDRYITLEPSGRKIAEMIYERHTLLTKLLVALDVPREVAVEDACRIEHVISPQSFEAIKEFAAAHLAKLEKANRTDEPEKQMAV